RQAIIVLHVNWTHHKLIVSNCSVHNLVAIPTPVVNYIDFLSGIKRLSKVKHTIFGVVPLVRDVLITHSEANVVEFLDFEHLHRTEVNDCLPTLMITTGYWIDIVGANGLNSNREVAERSVAG